MHAIVEKRALNPEDYLIKIEAPDIAEMYQPGQFVVIRIDEKGERIPLTVADLDAKKGTIAVIFKAVGKTTKQLGALGVGDAVSDCVGPLGKPDDIRKFGRVVCVGGGTGIACIYPLVRALVAAGNEVISIIGGRTESLLILEDEIKAASTENYVATEDGSKGYRGFVTGVLEGLLEKYKNSGGIDRVFAIGPLAMMRAVAEVTRPHNVKTMASLNTIMVDATGMCGSCRVFIDGEMKLTCIDGPTFDAHKVNFAEVMSRNDMFKEEEAIACKSYETEGGRDNAKGKQD